MNSVSHPWIARTLRASCALVALLVLAPGCDDGGGNGTDTATTTMTTGDSGSTSDSTEPTTSTSGSGMLSHAVDIRPIWDANCVTGCHAPMGTGSAWYIVDDGIYDALVDADSVQAPGVKRVVPGDRNASYLWHKLEGTQAQAGGSGTAMPPPPATLSAADKEKIGQWIDQGALP
jgi:hypothetical protein